MSWLDRIGVVLVQAAFQRNNAEMPTLAGR